MTSKEIFPTDVREVLDYIEHGDVLKGSYHSITHGGAMNGTASETQDPYTNLEEALQFYQDEDVEPPYHFLLDITADALGDIPPASGDQERSLDRAFILYEEEQDFYGMMKKKLEGQSPELGLKPDQLNHLADIVSSDLLQIARARLLCKEPHPYFEAMLNVYKNQGLPVGWIGSEFASEGHFVIYSHP
ncbi:hypothetical protein M3629_16225 [Paenibacillus polysaccharolyticus]|uniref:hypothetical protein n=1 Tax=Paenibacillus polysaccharolyticus TaxID=582692 RepID=UPI00203D7E88|nr:hypothetical protein [Paenibacillus polysaccharolyticus]MCM3134341.1 hypothetical protein [Paenibacillus polysaccharolyticus]